MSQYPVIILQDHVNIFCYAPQKITVTHDYFAASQDYFTGPCEHFVNYLQGAVNNLQCPTETLQGHYHLSPAQGQSHDSMGSSEAVQME